LARNWMRENTKLKKRVDTHDEQIGELLMMSTADHKTLQLHGRELALLRELSEVQAQRITHAQASLGTLRRIARRRPARKRMHT